MKRFAPFLMLAFCAAVHARPASPLHAQACELDSDPVRETPAEVDALHNPGTGGAAAAEYVAHRNRLEAPALPSAATRTQRVEWEDAKRMILRGYVVTIEQAHDRAVLVRTDRGNVFTAVEPEIDDVLKIASVVDPCHRFIKIITE